MRTIIVFISLLLSISVFAQDSTKTQKHLSKHTRNFGGDTILPAGKNELVFNMGSIFSAMLGNAADNQAIYSLFYKRALKNSKIYFRAGFIYKPEVQNRFFSSNTDLYFDQADSSRTRNIFQIPKKKPMQVNVGLEWRSKGYRRWSFYGAFDLIGGVFFRDYVLYDVKEKINSSGDWLPDVSTNYITFLDDQKSFNWYVGFSANFGIRYAFNKHWVISVQTGGEGTFNEDETYVRNDMATSLIRQRNNYFDFNMVGFLNEFALVYRF